MIQEQLPYLYYFYLVAKYKSFTQAAQVLHISQSAVSMQVKKLEENLSISLFHRHVRNRVELTKQGCLLMQSCQEIFDKLNQSFNKMTAQEIAGDLVVNSSVLFGTYVLVPFLKVFRDNYPKINVVLQLTDEFVDLQRENIDLVIRWGHHRDPKLKFHPLMVQEQVPVASKDYLKNYPKLTHPRQLKDHTVITWTDARPDWTDWLKQVPKKDRPEFKHVLPIQNVSAQVQAIKAGIGVALVPVYTVIDMVRKKQLKILFPNWKPRYHPAFACYLKSEFVSEKKKGFIQCLKSYLDRLPLEKR